MDSELERLEELFWQASQLESETERLAFLDKACGANEHLRARVVRLLYNRTAADEMAQAFQPTLALARDDMTDRTIGPYKLREKIGEGGMGVVYAADQKAPVKRRVALKVIKPGMDSRHVIARFESERQTLALMDHPYIARVLDAGTTEQGLPYFAMELVNGIPITRYCDEHRLTIRQRLELMVPICRAVQHAHQKGIIHRDLKPSNILVAQYDGKPVPKVIDFGVAKAVGSQLGDYSVYTEFGMLVGTLEYMSPEQAQRNQLDIDTRSDVYSLGVVLYELLAGATPFDGKRLRSAALDEMLRIIRDEEPPRPSLKLSTSRTLPDVASSRSVTPDRLSKVVRGELDWIVMKAMEKDRNRRYESSLSLGQDLERFLNSEPVLASPASVTYRARKYITRNWMRLTAVTCFLLAVAAGIMAWQWRIQELADQRLVHRLREEKLTERVMAFANDDDWKSGLNLLEQEINSVQPFDVPHGGDSSLVPLQKRLQFLQALEESRLSKAARTKAGAIGTTQADVAYRLAFADFGVYPETEAIQQAANKLRSNPLGLTRICEALVDWASVKKLAAVLPETRWEITLQSELTHLPTTERPLTPEIREQCQKLLDLADALDGDSFRMQLRRLLIGGESKVSAEELTRLEDFQSQPTNTRLLFAAILYSIGDVENAVALAEQLQHDSPGDFWANHDLAVYLRDGMKQPDKAIRYFTATLALKPASTAALSGLAESLFLAGQHQEAERYLEELVTTDPDLAGSWLTLGNVRKAQRKMEQAREAYRKVLELEPNFAGAWLNIGVSYYEARELEAARQAFEKAIETDSRYVIAINHLGSVLDEQGQTPQAETMYRRVIEEQPNYAFAYNRLGLNLRKQKKHEEAIEVFRSGLKATSADSQTVCNLAINLGMTLRSWAPKDEAREMEAIEAFRRCVEIDPEWGPGHDQLSRALSTSRYKHLRDPEQAVFHGQRVVDIAMATRGSAGAYELATLGMAHYRAGNWQACLDTLSSPNVRPDSASAPTDLFIAMATWHAGDQEKARQLISQAVERISKSEKSNSLEREVLAEAKALIKENAEAGEAKSDLEPARSDSISKSPSREN